MTLSQPDKGAGEEQKRKVIAARFFIARSDAAAPLDAVKETLNTVAYPEKPLVVAAADFSGRLRRDHRFHAARFDSCTDSLRVVSRIADEGASLRVLKQ